MKRLYTLLVLLASITCVQAADYCKEGMRSQKVSEVIDARIRLIYDDVLHLSGYAWKAPLLCQQDAPGGVPFPVAGNMWGIGGYDYVITLQYGAAQMSDVVLRGLLAHEIGHPFLGFRALHDRRAGVREEIAVDKIAAEWVGKNAVITALEAIRPAVMQWIKKDRAFYRKQFDDRLRALRQ